MRKKFEINELIEIRGQQINLSAKGEAILYSGDFMNPSESVVHYDHLEINSLKISSLENSLSLLIQENIDDIILDRVLKKSEI